MSHNPPSAGDSHMPSASEPIRTWIDWHVPAIGCMPDDETTVFLAVVYKTTGMRDVLNGFRDGIEWKFDDGSTVDRIATVTHWANWPEPPEVK